MQVSGSIYVASTEETQTRSLGSRKSSKSSVVPHFSVGPRWDSRSASVGESDREIYGLAVESDSSSRTFLGCLEAPPRLQLADAKFRRYLDHGLWKALGGNAIFMAPLIKKANEMLRLLNASLRILHFFFTLPGNKSREGAFWVLLRGDHRASNDSSFRYVRRDAHRRTRTDADLVRRQHYKLGRPQRSVPPSISTPQ